MAFSRRRGACLGSDSGSAQRLVEPMDFSWSKLHHGTCGYSKCFFPVSTLASPGPSGGSNVATGERDAQGQAMGWIAQSLGRQSGQAALSAWVQTWELAKDLNTRYGANHLFLGPPRRIALGDSDAALLNAQLTRFIIPSANLGKRYTEGIVLVQPVRSCPPPSCLLIGCDHGNKKGTSGKSFALRLAAFLKQVHDKAKFKHALEQNIRSWNAMTQATTCLQHDFQAFIRNDGQIFYVDLDRCILDLAPKMRNRYIGSSTLRTVYREIHGDFVLGQIDSIFRLALSRSTRSHLPPSTQTSNQTPSPAD